MTPPPAERQTSIALARCTSAIGSIIVGLALAACSRAPVTPAPAPLPAPGTPELAIYRTVAESIYVRTTKRAVGIVTATLDTACERTTCKPLGTRWGLEPLWWATGDSSAAIAARADLLERTSHPMSLADVSQGQPLLQSVAPDSAALVTAQPDTAHWTTFKENHGAPSGFLRFSPIGFDASHRSAIVFVDWQCGPVCGHTVAVALSAAGDNTWRIDDMLLLSSRAANGTLGGR